MRNLSTRRLSLAAASLAGIAALSALSACGSDDETASDPAATASTPSEATASATPTESASPTAATTTDAPPSASTSATGSANDLITLSAPTAGQVVTGSFKAAGTANSPEANVPWNLADASGTVVREGYFTAEGWMDKLYPYAGTVDLAGLKAGSYTFTVSVDDESDGEGTDQGIGVPVTVK